MQHQNRIQEVCAGITKAMCHSVAQRLRDCLENEEHFLSSYHEHI